MLILCKIAYKSLLINVVLLSGAPELRFLPINYGRICMGIKSPRQGRPAGLPGTFDPHADSAIMISWILWIWGPIWQNYINKTCLECDFASNKVKKIILPCPVKFGVSAQPPTYLLTLGFTARFVNSGTRSMFYKGKAIRDDMGHLITIPINLWDSMTMLQRDINNLNF